MQKLKIFIIASFLLFSVDAIAQQGTSSPYSISGLGELSYGGFTQHVAAGRTSVTQKSANNFSPANPASYANLRFTVFDVGTKLSFGQLSTATSEANTRSGNFDHFAMAFPIEAKRRMGVSFGLNQYSDVGYDIKNTIDTDTPNYYNLFRGNGGINRVYAGYAIELFPNLNIGANVSYNFGNVQSVSAKVFPNTNDVFSFSNETYFAYKGIDFDLGFQYSVHDTIRFKGKKRSVLSHTIGGAMQTSTDLTGEGYRYGETFYGTQFDLGRNLPIDTLFFDDNLLDTAQKPFSFSIGYTLSKGDQWALSLEMEQKMWSDVQAKNLSNPFYNNVRYSAGFSIVPSPNYDERGNFFKKIRYSVGARYENLHYNFDNTQLNEIGISFGLGLPITKSVRIEDEKIPVVSRVNLTAEYVKRGSTADGLIQEDYLNIGLGLNLNDKWFTKRKYR